MLTIDGFPVDVEISCEPTFENEVTDYPVEGDSDHTDHVITRPMMLQIEGVVSDTPLAAMADSRAQFTLIDGEAFARPSQEARARLVEIHESKEPVTVESASGVWDDMVLQTLTWRQDRNTGKALRFSATFKKIIITVVERLSVRVEMPRAKSKLDRGFKAAVDAVTTIGSGILSAANPFGAGSELVVPATNNLTENANRLNHNRVANRRPSLLRGLDPAQTTGSDPVALLK